MCKHGDGRLNLEVDTHNVPYESSDEEGDSKS